MFEPALLAACLLLGTDPNLIRAIIAQESAGRIAALNINRWQGAPVRTDSVQEAVNSAKRSIEQGYSVDMGLMGINSVHLPRFKLSVENVFEPCTNIQIGEQILNENIQTAHRAKLVGDQALRGALSLYNTGSLTRGLKNGYVDRIWSRYQRTIVKAAREADSVVPWGVRTDPITVSHNPVITPVISHEGAQR